MKAYILTEQDLERLLLVINTDPAHGSNGGSSNPLNEEEKRIYDDAHRFYGYNVRKWIDLIK